MIAAVLRRIDRALACPVVMFLKVYRLLVSPLYGQTCRFYPSCSAYALESVTRHGFVRGIRLSGWRLLRCNPWNAGGVDLVPPVDATSARSVHGSPPAAVGRHGACLHDGGPGFRSAA